MRTSNKKPSLPPSAPPRLVDFFANEVDKYKDRFAYGMAYRAADDKSKMKFGFDAVEAARDAEIEVPDHYFSLGQIGSEGNEGFVVDGSKAELPVLYFEHEAGFHPHAPSLDAFLKNLLTKGEMTPLARLEKLVEKATKLDETKKNAEVIALLEAEVTKHAPETVVALDNVAESLPEAHNLLGLAYKNLGRIEEAEAHYNTAVAMGSNMAELNVCELLLEQKRYSDVVAFAENVARSSFRGGDAYEWFHANKTLGVAHAVLGNEASATEVFHAIWDRFHAKDLSRMEEVTKLLREATREAPQIAERILAWFEPQQRSVDEAQSATRQAWWATVPKAFQAQLRTEVADDDEGKISDAVLERIVQLTNLDVPPDAKVRDLSMLEPFQRLTTLDLDGTKLADLSTLPSLPHLKELSAKECGLTSLRGLDRLPGLTKLSVGENKLTSLDGVEALKELIDLSADQNRIESLEALRGLTELQDLSVYENRITDLSPLAECTRLKEITCFENKISKGLSELTNLPYLESISVVEWKVSKAEMDSFQEARPDVDLDLDSRRKREPETTDADRAAWSSLPTEWRRALQKDEDGESSKLDKKLASIFAETSLFFSEAGITDLAPVSRFSLADFATFARNAITSFAPISFLKRLRQLRLSDNRATSLEGIEQLEHLYELDVARNPVVALGPLAALTQMRDLDLTRTAVKDLAPLAGLMNLRELSIGGTQVTSLAPIAKLARLTRIDLHMTAVKDVSPLAGCTALESVVCYGNTGLAGAVALAKLPRLHTIHSHGSLSSREINELKKLRPDISAE